MPALASRGKGRRTINEINMVPFIDVMLVLLIIFMVTAPLIAPSVIDLPSVGKAILGSSLAQPDFIGLVTDPVHGLGIPFMLAGPILAGICILIYIVTSLLTPRMDPVLVSQVCWDHPLSFLRGRVDGISDPRIVSLILIVLVGGLYYWLK